MTLNISGWEFVQDTKYTDKGYIKRGVIDYRSIEDYEKLGIILDTIEKNGYWKTKSSSGYETLRHYCRVWTHETESGNKTIIISAMF